MFLQDKGKKSEFKVGSTNFRGKESVFLWLMWTGSEDGE
jgi:hypothetical protein